MFLRSVRRNGLSIDAGGFLLCFTELLPLGDDSVELAALELGGVAVLLDLGGAAVVVELEQEAPIGEDIGHGDNGVAAPFFVAEEVVHRLFPEFQDVANGIVLLLIMIFLPRGLVDPRAIRLRSNSGQAATKVASPMPASTGGDAS